MTWIVLDETTKLLQTFVGRKKTTTEGNTMGSPPKRSDSNIVTFDIPPQQENDSGAGHDDNESSGSSLSSSFEGQSHYTMDEVVEVIGFGTFHWKLVLLCGVGYFAEITELVVVSFVAPSIQKQMNLSNLQYGALGSSSFVGMAVGALFWGYVSDHFGRQISFSLTVWLTFFGGAFSALSPNYAILLFLRFTAAFGIGGMLPVDYTVFLEFLPKEERGSNIVMVDAIGVVPALTLSAIIAWYFSGSEQVQWRWVLAISSIPVGIMAVLRRHVPESPRYHLARGDTGLAQSVVQQVADMNETDLPDDWKLLPQTQTSALTDAESTKRKKGEYVQMNQQDGHQPYQDDVEVSEEAGQNEVIPAVIGEDECEEEVTAAGGGHSFAQLLQGEKMRATTWRLWLLYFLVQFSSSGMVFALPKLFDESFPGKTERDIALDLLIGVVGLIPGLAIAYVAVEKSRKKSLAAFFFAAGLTVLFLGGAFVKMNSQMWAIVFSIVLRGAMEGCFAILNTTAVESYPTVLRASGLGTAQIFDHLAGSISPVIFGVLNGHQATKTWVFFFYAGAYILGMLPALTLPSDYAGQAVADF
jgi:putative MFS transporter